MSIVYPSTTTRETNREISGDSSKIRKFRSSIRINQVTGKSSTNNITSEKDKFYGRSELDSHADTIVAGRNCVVTKFTTKTCEVSPYSDAYESVKDVPVVQAATGYTSVTGRNYIIIFNEALYMPSLDHSLINPNQLRHFQTTVKDNPYEIGGMIIRSPDQDLTLCLKSAGTTIYFDSWTPTIEDLDVLPHVVLSSPHPWNPATIQFPTISYSAMEEIERRSVSELITFDTGFDATMSAQGDLTRQESIAPSETSSLCDRIIRSMATSPMTQHNELMERKKPVPHESNLVQSILSESDMKPTRTFISKDRHSDATPEDLSEKWNISVSQAMLTLRATTRKLTRSAIMPLARRYRVDMMFDENQLRQTFATDTMHMPVTSIRGHKFAQVFATKDFFVEAYPITKKSNAGDALNSFVRDYGVPHTLRYDGSKEQVSPGTKFQKIIRKYDIRGKVGEPHRPNQNPAEGVIRELRKKWYRTMFKTNCPKRLWCFGLIYEAKILQRTASYAGDLQGRTPIEKILGETPDISEYMDFGFYDWVVFKQDAGIGETGLARFLGVATGVGSLMSYWILPQTGIPIVRSTVQRVTILEQQTDAIRQRMIDFDKEIHDKFRGDFHVDVDGEKNHQLLGVLMEDPDFVNEFHKSFSHEDIPEADYTPDTYDSYLNMELAIDRGGEQPAFGTVTKRLKDAHGKPIGKANANPVLDTRLYEVRFVDGETMPITANLVAQNMYAQVDTDGHRMVLFDEIIDTRRSNDAVSKAEAYVTSPRGIQRRKRTTKGWEVLVRWRDGSTTWNALKDVKDSYPVQLAEYAEMNGIADEPAFAWWVDFVLRHRKRTLAKLKSKYWIRTHKYGIRIPKSVREALEIDAENGDDQWWNAIQLEMKNVRPAFRKHEGDPKELVGYQKVRCHMIFDVKLGENFRRKARLVGGGHTTVTPSSLTYSSVVSRDSVRILLTVAALNDLDVLACDIQNAYLTAKCRERIYTVAGPEFGSEEGCTMIVEMALYGLKSSGAAFRSKLASVLYDMNYRASLADPDVWMRMATKPSGTRYYEYVLCYVDDVLVLSESPMKTMDGIRGVFKLKGDKTEKPDMYLGAQVNEVRTDNGTKCWSLSSEKYVKAAVSNVDATLKKSGSKLPSNCPTPCTTGYHPAEDTSKELNAEGTRLFQELIGVLRWAIEIGRIDILLEVSLLSSHLAMPRSGHLQEVYHIFGYLRQSPRRRLFLDPDHPVISEDRFKKFDWEDFYREAKEDVPTNMPDPLGKAVSTHCFVDASHASDKVTRKSQTGILIFINRAPTMWHSKRQNSVEVSTFGSEFIALKNAIELVMGLRYKIRMFGIPIEGPTNIFCDNEAVYKNASQPDSTLSKKQHSIAYHFCREKVASGVCRLAKENTKTNLADVFTKTMNKPKREELLGGFMY